MKYFCIPEYYAQTNKYSPSFQGLHAQLLLLAVKKKTGEGLGGFIT